MHRLEKVRLSIPLFVVLYLILVAINFAVSQEEFGITNIYVTVLWSTFFPIALIGTIGALYSYRLKVSEFNTPVKNKVIFQIPTIGRKGNLPALFRVVDSIIRWGPKLLPNLRIDIITEEKSDGTDSIQKKYLQENLVRVLVVPAEYKTKNGTKYKARANQYAVEIRRKEGENTKSDWIYHLDDDTAVGSDTISSIAETINKDTGRYHLAQGILTFPHELSGSVLSKLTDSIRPIDDLTKFYFFTKLLKRPLVGLHGEHLLLRSSIEDLIEWDFGPNAITEDAEFALHFSNRFKNSSTFLNSFSYGASPESISDLIKQRRRWSKGLIDLVVRTKVPFLLKVPIGYMVLNWATGFFQNIFFVLMLSLILRGNTSPLHFIFLFIWSYNFAYQIWLYWEGYKINLMVSKMSRILSLKTLLLFPGIFIFSFLESFSTLLGLLDYISKKKGFVVISKPL